MRIGVTELLVILAIVLLLFGSRKLPELADGMGKAIRNFKRGINSDDEDVTPEPPSAAKSAEKQVTSRSSASDVSSETSEASRKG